MRKKLNIYKVFKKGNLNLKIPRGQCKECGKDIKDKRRKLCSDCDVMVLEAKKKVRD